MALFECRTYIEFLTERAANQHGALLRLANQSGVHPSVISQVMKGKRDLTLEQAMAVAQYFELSGKETSHFLLLVQEARAGTPALKKVMRFQVEESRAANARLAERVKPERALSLDQKAVFYSAWYYSALHLLSVVPAFRAKDALRKRLGLSKERFRAALSYLKEVGLCREKEGFVEALSGSTHLPFDSPLIQNHHANWRLHAINRYECMSPTKEMAFTCPMALSEGDALKVRAKLLAAIEEVCAIADPSPSETVYYLNLDWRKLFEKAKVRSTTSRLRIPGFPDEVTALNYPEKMRIDLNRARWAKVRVAPQREGLALHEFLSLANLESTGNYAFSSIYLMMFNESPDPLFGPRPPRIAPDPSEINKIYSYSCRKTFFEGEGVSRGQVACPANQHLTALFADYTFFLNRVAARDNFLDRETDKDGLVCNAYMPLLRCDEEPVLNFGLSAKQEGQFLAAVYLNYRVGQASLQGYAALADADGKCPVSLLPAQPLVAHIEAVSTPYPNNFQNRSSNLDDFMFAVADGPKNFSIFRQTSSRTCNGSSSDQSNPTGACSVPDGPLIEWMYMHYQPRQPKLCVIPKERLK